MNRRLSVTNLSWKITSPTIQLSCHQDESEEVRIKLTLYSHAHFGGYTEKSAVAGHAWENHHPIHQEETTMVDHLAEDKSYW